MTDNPPRKTEAIIFDLSEVFILGIRGLEDSLSREFGGTREDVYRHIRGDNFRAFLCGRISEDEYLDNVKRMAGWKAANDVLKERFRQNFLVKMPGSEQLLAKVKAASGKGDKGQEKGKEMGKDKGFTLHLLSDHAREWIVFIKEKHPFLGWFDSLMFSYDFGMTKWDRALFPIVLQKIGRQPGETLFIDDWPLNVDNARAAGMDAVLFESADQVEAELKVKGILP